MGRGANMESVPAPEAHFAAPTCYEPHFSMKGTIVFMIGGPLTFIDPASFGFSASFSLSFPKSL